MEGDGGINIRGGGSRSFAFGSPVDDMAFQSRTASVRRIWHVRMRTEVWGSSIARQAWVVVDKNTAGTIPRSREEILLAQIFLALGPQTLSEFSWSATATFWLSVLSHYSTIGAILA